MSNTKKTNKSKEQNTNENSIKLSVLDIEQKYKWIPEEYSYGTNSYVSWGEDNRLPALYQSCYENSATLHSIIDGSVNYVNGDVVIVNDDAAFWKIQVNRKGMKMDEFLRRLEHSFFVYGGFAFQIVYNKLSLPVELYPLDFGRCRTNEYATKVWYSKKWSKYQTKAEEYDVYDPNMIDPEKPTQIYYYKGDSTSRVYPLPPYAGALVDVLTEIECSKYSLSTVARGFSAKYIINFPDVGNLTNEQKRGIEQSIKNKFCGSESDSNFMMYWKNGENDKAEIQKIESDETPERYIAIKDNARQNIFVAMRCTPVLFGLPNASNGFSTDEYRDSFKIFDKTVISPIRDTILGAVNKVIGIENGVTIAPFSIDFEEENANNNVNEE